MNNEKNNFTSNSPIIDNKTIEDIYKENFKKYFQEIHKVMPHYLQNITQLQESFLEAWINTMKMTIENQNQYVKTSGFDLEIPKEATDLIYKAAEEYLKVKNNQNQAIVTSLDALGSNIKNFEENSQSFIEINRKLLDSWFRTLSQNNN